MKEATGAIYKPTGPVDQHIGDRITQIVQPHEKLPVPRIQAPPQDFIGREKELERLQSRFDTGATITGLRGMGGIGKTALALVLADRLKGRFQDGQIFLKLDGIGTNPLKPTDAMAQVIRAFRGSAERLPEDQNELQGLYNSVLYGKHALLLLDNAADRKQVEPLLPPKGCAVIVTSRKKFTLPGMPEPFLLETMKPSEARDLLLKICPRVGVHADELAKLCGYLPHALRASASLLAVKSDLNPESYLEELRSERNRLEKIGNEGVDLDEEASLNLSYSRLPAEMASVFCMLSIFPSDFGAVAEEAICQDRDHAQLSNLVTWSLVEFEEETGRYHLHDLVRLFAARLLREKCKEVARSEASRRHAEYYKEVLSSATELYQHGGKDLLAGLRKFDLERMNIDAGWIWTKENFKVDNVAALLCSAYLNWPFLLNLRLHPKEQISWLETALAAARQLKNKNMECVHLGNLGAAYASLGDSRKAIEFYEKSRVISRVIGDRRSEGGDLGNLGLAYANLGDSRKAIEFYEKALVIAREIWERRGEGVHLGNLGLAYADLGDSRKAIEFYEKRLVIAREIGDRRGEGYDLGNLGAAYAALGDSRKAIEFHQQALVIAREIGDRRGEGNALWNMSLSLDKLGQRAEAIESAKSALKIYEQIESPTAERVRKNLAEWQG